MEESLSEEVQINREILTVLEDESNTRLDRFLVNRYPDYSRHYFQTLILEASVLLNGEKSQKRIRVSEGDQVSIEFKELSAIEVEPEAIDLEILYEDKDLIVVNKPPGMVTHPGAGNTNGTFANALVYHCGDEIKKVNPIRPGIVHRLDKETSGLLVAAKNRVSHQKLSSIFANRQVDKDYLLITCKEAPPSFVEGLITRDPKHRKKMTLSEVQGRHSRTEFELLDKTEIDTQKLFLVRARLLTGRTHQIRVHCLHSHAPILGDKSYGWPAWADKFKAKRQMLHAWKLSFKHPITGEVLDFTAPVPCDMEEVMTQLDLSEEKK